MRPDQVEAGASMLLLTIRWRRWTGATRAGLTMASLGEHLGRKPASVFRKLSGELRRARPE
jgi:hypothetical protein